jgi:UDP-glucose 4-epimerase
MKAATLITGAAGFVGCNLAAALLARGERVVGFDNLCRGSDHSLDPIRGNPDFSFEVLDLADFDRYREALYEIHSRTPVTEIWHMAASSDIPAGVADARVDLRDTFMTTFNTLELMKELKIPTLAFASSSAIYGDLGDRTLEEGAGPLFPISNYGAMKLASEAMISAAVENFLARAFIFRFPNVIGTPATHGVILDFIRKLKSAPKNLSVLGDGSQQKSYLHVEELLDAMLYIREHASEKLNFFYIGADDKGVTVRYIAEQVVKAVAPRATISYGSTNKGWIGDVPRFTYSIAKLSALGWRPTLGSAQAVRKAVRQIAEQESKI